MSTPINQPNKDSIRRRENSVTFDIIQEEEEEQEEPRSPTEPMSDSGSHEAAMEQETEHYLHLYSELTNNVFSDESNYGKPIILSSLSKLDELLKANTTTVSRVPGLNVDTVSTDDGKYFLRCHLATLLDFSHDDDIPYKHSFEAAAACRSK